MSWSERNGRASEGVATGVAVSPNERVARAKAETLCANPSGAAPARG